MKRPSDFVVCLAMVIVAIVGAALLPRINVGIDPPQRQGKTLTVTVRWQGVAAKVMENSVTSVLEGVLSGVKDVESVSSESFYGKGKVKIQLKENADVAATRFEMSSLLRQVYSRLPEGVGYPVLTGGETVGDTDDKNERVVLLTYNVNADMPQERIGDYLEHSGIVQQLRQIDGVENVTLSGYADSYWELTYDAQTLALYAITPADIASAVKNFTGQRNVVGDVSPDGADDDGRRRTLYLAAKPVPLAQIPVRTKDGSVVYLNNLVQQQLKKRSPDNYYRINGLNTVTVSLEVAGDANKIWLSSAIQRSVDDVAKSLPRGMYLTLASDAAADERAEMTDLVGRSLLSLAILLAFVWITSRRWRYLLVITLSLALNLLLAAIVYWMMHLKLHVFSMAGMAVSLSLIIDATIVMADHYGYYRNRKAFLAVLAAMLTTIGSLVSVFFLPDDWQNDLYDFVRIISINLAASLVVALVFVPTLVDVLHYDPRHGLSMGRLRRIVGWNRFYLGYVSLVQRRKWIPVALLLTAFGFALRGFIDHLDYTADRHGDERLVLHIQAEMPLGGSASELNQKVVILENLLKRTTEIKRFVTSINGRRASIDVDFRDSCQQTSAPFRVEQEVIAKAMGIGGCDWAVYGVSPMGFSNSLDLQHRSNRIHIAGYNYDHLNRYADELGRMLCRNTRVRDLIVKAPDREVGEDELHMDYNRERMALYGIQPRDVHGCLSGMLSSVEVGKYDDGERQIDVVLRPMQTDRFDRWQMNNAYVGGTDRQFKTSDLMNVERRAAKNYILKRNQEYVLAVEFNVLGSYQYAADYVRESVDSFNCRLPMGYMCKTPTYHQKDDREAPYWIIGVVVVVVFFICAVLFESLRLPLVIISVIPVSFIGIFLTYRWCDLEFGTGGLAAMVMLAGIVVNSAIYILNEYRQLGKEEALKGRPRAVLYVKAYSHKVIPVALTILSTVLGLVPFFFDGQQKQPFWFSFAAGVVGGLLFSFLVIVFVLPVFVALKPRQRKGQ